MKKRTILALLLLSLPLIAKAGYTPTATPFPTDNTLDDFIDLYKTKAAMWQTVLASKAQFVFITLATIEFVWMGITLALRGTDFQEFTIEVFKRIMFIGFFWALFLFGPAWSFAIINSLSQSADAASVASGGVAGMTPSLLFDQALDLFMEVTSRMTLFDVVAGIASVVCAVIICVGLAITVSFLVLALIETYICVSAGVILLGFGGSRWTKDYALAYLRYAFGAGIKLFLTQLIIAIGGAIISDWMAYANTNPTLVTLKGLMLLGGVSIVQAILVGKIPGMAQGLIQGVALGGGDELAAPARMAATTAATFTGAGATMAAARSAFGSTIGGARALTSAASMANTQVAPNAGAGAGARVQGFISGRQQTLSGTRQSAASRVRASVGAAAGRATAAAVRASMVAGRTTSNLAGAARGDYLGQNDGSVRPFGTLGGRLARAIRDDRNNT